MSSNKGVKLYKHFEYLKSEKSWKVIRDLVEGDHGTLVSNYLWYHTSEKTSEFTDERDINNAKNDRNLRETRTQYENHLQHIQERFVDLLMKGGLDFTSLSDQLTEEELNNIDGNQHSIDLFAQHLCENLITEGVAYVLTDTQANQAVRSRKDEIDLKARPYLIRLDPMGLVDWDEAKDGSYKTARYEYFEQIPRESLLDEPKIGVFTNIFELRKNGNGNPYYYIRKLQAHDKDGKPLINVDLYVDTDINWIEVDKMQVDELPFIPLSTNKIQKSWLKRIVPYALKIFNKESELDNILHNQCYDKLFIFADLSREQNEDGSEMSESKKTRIINVNTITVINDPDGSIVKIEPTNPEALERSIVSDTINMFRNAFNLMRAGKIDSGVAESAESRQEAKEELLTKLENKRQELLDILNDAFKNYLIFKNKKLTKDQIKVDLKFKKPLKEADLTTLTELVAVSLSRLSKYPLMVKEIDKKVVDLLLLPNSDQIKDEIDKAVFDNETLANNNFVNRLNTLANVQPR